MQIPAVAIANKILEIAWKSNIDLSQIQLQKLVYIAHGWFLGGTGRPLIREEVCAWKFGPVIPELYNSFKFFGATKISKERYNTYKLLSSASFSEITLEHLNLDKTLYKSLVEFLEGIWNTYKEKDSFDLVELTHEKNSPWSYVKRKNKHAIGKNLGIPNSLIREYYKKKIEKIKSPK